MALSQTTTIQTTAGVPVTLINAYIKVASVIANKDVISTTVHVCAESNGSVASSQTYQFKHNLLGDNSIKQAYEYLKTLPEFANATDC